MDASDGQSGVAAARRRAPGRGATVRFVGRRVFVFVVVVAAVAVTTTPAATDGRCNDDAAAVDPPPDRGVFHGRVRRAHVATADAAPAPAPATAAAPVAATAPGAAAAPDAAPDPVADAQIPPPPSPSPPPPAPNYNRTLAKHRAHTIDCAAPRPNRRRFSGKSCHSERSPFPAINAIFPLVIVL